jgi:RNA polymerase sigma factor (sigma-70 family)
VDRYTFDDDYVARLKRRDPETERHFSIYFGERLLLKLRSQPAFAHAAEDLRQETLMRVLEKIQSGQVYHADRLGAYVVGVCNNILLEQSRKDRRTEPMENAPEPVDWRQTADGLLINEERKARVRQVLDDLPARDRLLLEEIFLKERDKDEVCREFQVDRDYLRVLLFRARKRFRTVLTVAEAAATQPK